MSDGNQYDADYYLRGKQTGKSLYENYRWMPELTKPMVSRMIAHLGIQPHHTILDFGCARGYTVRAFREMGYDAWGHDISQWALENADKEASNYLICNNSALWADSFDWVIAKDVLEHVEDLEVTVESLKEIARLGIFVVVPLAHGEFYDVEEYEADVTHIHRRPISWWMSQLCQDGWSVEGRYRLPGIKDNYSQYPTGNGFITCRRI